MKALFGRWIATKAALAVAGALVIGGAVGSAIAVNPINSGPAIKWAGGVPVIRGSVPNGGNLGIYTVPAGKNFMLTDILVSIGPTDSLGAFSLYAGTADCDTLLDANIKLDTVIIPPRGTVVIPLNTGFGFTSGQTVCIDAAETSPAMIVNARGYLFTAAPAS